MTADPPDGDTVDAVLAAVDIPSLPGFYRGKVRDNWDLGDGRRIVVATDRLSVFDQIIGVVPFKGQVLNELALFWFAKTADIVPNHVLASIDPNVIGVRTLSMAPVEVVVRDYLAGSSATSLWTMYKAGQRAMYGLSLPDGLGENEKLPETVITPTTKAGPGEHDLPLSAHDIVSRGLLPARRWDEIAAVALQLFRRGREIARANGLLLVDTKYEFGFDADGRLVLADEIHTPDSSRYWRAGSYEERMARGDRPENLDKDFARAWITAHCDPYRDPIPPLPADTVAEFTRRYRSLFATVTGQPFVPAHRRRPAVEEVRDRILDYAGTPAG